VRLSRGVLTTGVLGRVIGRVSVILRAVQYSSEARGELLLGLLYLRRGHGDGHDRQFGDKDVSWQRPKCHEHEGARDDEDNAIEVEEQLANGGHVLRGERRLIDLPM
jgi:hypothetical protein